MALDPSVVEHIAKLARIDIQTLDATDRNQLVNDMNRLVGFVDLLAEVDVDGVEPMAHPNDLTLRLRDDDPAETPGVERILANAPSAAEGAFLVPQVVSGGGADEQ